MLVTAELATAFKGEPRYTPVFEHPGLPTAATVGATAACDTLAPAGPPFSACLPDEFIQSFAGVSRTPAGMATALALSVGLVILLLVLAPVLYAEWLSPPAPPPEKKQRAFDARSLRLGVGLDFAFDAARITGELQTTVCIFAAVALFFSLPFYWTAIPGWFRPNPDLGFPLWGKVLLGSGASAAGIVAVLHWLSGAGSGLRPALGIAVDVDNYLREFPKDRTPRARMAERYTSLLRFICEWRADSADSNSGYDTLIIVAHSQGTVISADLLRYLAQERTRSPGFEPRLARLAGVGDGKELAVGFFTMGSPLRQLYARRFPDLYRWATQNEVDQSGLSAADTMLGKPLWVNAYRSADYVGRNLTVSGRRSS